MSKIGTNEQCQRVLEFKGGQCVTCATWTTRKGSIRERKCADYRSIMTKSVLTDEDEEKERKRANRNIIRIVYDKGLYNFAELANTCARNPICSRTYASTPIFFGQYFKSKQFLPKNS